MPTPKTSKFAEIDAELSSPAIKCKLCALITDMDGEDADYVRAMLRQPVKVKGHKHIATVLGRGGVDVSSSTVGACRTAGHQA